MRKTLFAVFMICASMQLFSQSLGGTLANAATVTVIAPEKDSMTASDLYAVIVEGQVLAELFIGDKADLQLPAGDVLFYFLGYMKEDEDYSPRQEPYPLLYTLEKGKNYTIQINSAFSVPGIKLDVSAK